jgi:hypothetical protein
VPRSRGAGRGQEHRIVCPGLLARGLVLATAYAAVVVVLALTAALATELTLGASKRGTTAASATGDSG